MRKVALAVLVGVAVSGCGGKGARYADHVGSLGPPVRGEARVVVYRTGDTTQYMGRAATVRLDDRRLGFVDHKGYNVFDVPAGRHVLVAEMKLMAGDCALDVRLDPGSETFFEVAPRKGKFFAGVIGGLIGEGIDAAVRDCGGAFSIVPVDPGKARSRIRDLGLSGE